MRLGPRRHPELDLLLWCRHGQARIGHDGTDTTLGPGQALLLPCGTGHTVELPAGALLLPVFLPPAPGVGPAGPGPGPFAVDAHLAAVLLVLAVSGATELRPSVSRIEALHAAVRQRAGLPGPVAAASGGVTASHIEWVVNADAAVLVLAEFGPVSVMLRGPGPAEQVVELEAHMALDIPPGVEHRIITRDGGVAVPVFHPPRPGHPGVELCVPTAALRVLAQRHLVADVTALRPPGWDEHRLGRGLAETLQRTLVRGSHGGQPRAVDRLREAVLRDPAGPASPATWARRTAAPGGEAATRRALEREFRRVTGTSFVPWRNQVRAEQATALLREGMAVKTVARRLGFAHASGFTRAFTAATGAPPRSVRT